MSSPPPGSGQLNMSRSMQQPQQFGTNSSGNMGMQGGADGYGGLTGVSAADIMRDIQAAAEDDWYRTFRPFGVTGSTNAHTASSMLQPYQS